MSADFSSKGKALLQGQAWLLTDHKCKQLSLSDVQTRGHTADILASLSAGALLVQPGSDQSLAPGRWIWAKEGTSSPLPT